MAERPKIGELLVAAGVIESAALESALEKQRSQGGRLGKILLAMGVLDEEMLVRTVARQLDMPVVWLRGKQVKAEVLSTLPKHVAVRHRCLPVMLDRKGQETLLVAMEDPSDSVALDEVAIAAGRPVRVVLAAPSELDDALARHYPAEVEPEAPEDDEPELLLTDKLDETGGGEPELRRLERDEAPAEQPAPEPLAAPEPAPSVDPLDLGGEFDPGARSYGDLPVHDDLSVSSDLGAPGTFHADDIAGASAAPDDAQEAIAADERGADLDIAPAPDSVADLGAPDDLGLDLPPAAPALREGDSLDDAIDAVRGAGADDEIAHESDDDGASIFGDDPLDATLPPRPVRADAPAQADALPRDVDALPRDLELRAVVLLLIERGLLTREDIALRLLALRGDEDASGS